MRIWCAPKPFGSRRVPPLNYDVEFAVWQQSDSGGFLHLKIALTVVSFSDWLRQVTCLILEWFTMCVSEHCDIGETGF